MRGKWGCISIPNRKSMGLHFKHSLSRSFGDAIWKKIRLTGKKLAVCIAKGILTGCWWEINWHNHLRKQLRVYLLTLTKHFIWGSEPSRKKYLHSPKERNCGRTSNQQSIGMVSSGDTRQPLESLDLSGFSLSSSKCWITDMQQYRTALSLDSDRNIGREIVKREEGSVSPAHYSNLEWTVTMGWLSGHQWAKTDIHHSNSIKRKPLFSTGLRK